MGKYNKSSNNNIFKEEPEISVSEHTVVKNGRKMKMVIPDGKIGYGDVESRQRGTTVEQNRVNLARRKMQGRMPVMNTFQITDNKGEVIATEVLFMKTEPSGLTRPLKIRIDAQSGKAQEVPL